MSEKGTGKLYFGKIELTKIDKSRLFKSEETNRIYCDVKVWVNEDADVDNYGNQLSIQQSTTKEEENIYIGNAKLYVGNNGGAKESAPVVDDNLPF